MRRAWQVASQSPHLPIVGYLVYVGTLGILSRALGFPIGLDVDVPAWLLWMWSLSLTAGGVLAIAGCVTERSRLESAGLALCLSGMFLYLAGNISAALTVSLLALMCVSRLWVLHEARKVHGDVVQLINRGAA